MFEVIFLKGGKVFPQEVFSTREEADDFINLGNHKFSCEYQVYDKEKGELVEEGDIESKDDIIEGTMNMLSTDE
jgi:hypothetical protein